MSLRRALPLLAAALVLLAGGCGRSRATAGLGTRLAAPPVAGAAPLPAPLATRNTVRIDGSDPVADAAAVAQAVYPGGPAGHPQAVVLADTRDPLAALAAAQLAGAPLHAPLLLSVGGSLPPDSAAALRALAPTGAPALGGAQVIRVGAAPSPPGLRSLAVTGSDPAALAAALARLGGQLRGTPDTAVLVVPSDRLAFAMPAAGLAAEAGVPILPVSAAGVPPATLATLARERLTPRIYVLGPGTVVPAADVRVLRRYGDVRRIRGGDPVSNAIALAGFSDGSFGWGVNQPGHGLVFLNAARPLDAAAAAPLSSTGDFAPQLLVDSTASLPAPLQGKLLDIQPGYEPGSAQYGATNANYNRGWIIGDERAVSPAEQAQIDQLLEIVPVSTPSAPNTP